MNTRVGVVIIGVVLVLVLTVSLPVAASSFALNSTRAISSQAAVDAGSNGQTIQLQEGEGLVVTLVSNHSTPYTWFLEEISDPAVLQKVSDVYIGPPLGSPIGASGTEVWTYKSLQAGRTTLLMEYRDASFGIVDSTFELEVVVLGQVPASSSLSGALMIGGVAGLAALLLVRRRNLVSIS